MIMKKSKLLSLGLASVIVLGPTSAFAAEGDYFLKSDGSRKYTSNQMQVDGIARNHVSVMPGDFQIEVNNKLYDFNTARAAYAQNPNNWKTILSGAVQGELKVVEVSAINAEKITVTFSKQMKSGTAGTYSAENLANYTLTESGNGAPVAITKVGLSSDGKTATLTLGAGAGLIQDKAYNLVVDNIVQDAQGNALHLTTDYSTALFFADRVKPSVTSVTSTGTGEAVITFSENLEATKPTIVINGISVLPGNITVAANKVTVSKAFFDTNAATVKKGVSHSVIVAGAKDLVLPTANEQDLFTGNFVYNGVTDVTAPTLTQVTVKNDTTLVVTFSEELINPTTGLPLTPAQKDGATDVSTLVFSSLKVLKGSTDVKAAASVATTKNGITFEVALDGTTADLLFNSKLGETSVNLTVEAAGFKDIALNAGITSTKSVTVAKDAAKPVVTKSSYDATNKAFVITFDKKLSASDDTKISVINKATGAVTPLVAATESIADNVLTIDNTSGAAGLNLAEGNYTVVLGAGSVTDSSLDKNKNASTTVDITVSNVVGSDVKPTIVGLPVAASDVVTVVFSEAVKSDATAASATNVNNYKINGAALPAGTIITYTGTTATITMPTGSVETSGTKVFTVSGVQDIAGNTIDTVNKAVAFVDTVAPKLVSAKVDADKKIVLTFSENVNGKGDSVIASEVQPLVGDFLVYVNGTLATGVTLENGAEDNQVKLTSTDVNFGSGTIVVKTAPAGPLTGADEAGLTLRLDTAVTATR